MSDLCWSRIGVQGDGSCPQLTEHVHCRNCPVYSAASLALLDREPPAERSLGPSDPLEKTRLQGDSQSVIVFRLAQEWLALPTSFCREVARRTRIHPLPDRNRERILGLANVHGELLVCVSLRRILQLGDEERAAESARNGHFLILGHADGSIICPVDEACGLARFHESELAPAPVTPGTGNRSYAKVALAWGERTVGLIDEGFIKAELSGSFASTPI